MKILKFGGTSVANAKNINLILSIVKKTADTSTKLVVVVSAFSGVTDLLILAAKKAAKKDNSFKEVVLQIEEKHKEAIEELIITSQQKPLLDDINSDINHLKTLLDGCFLLGELSNRTSDRIMGFGELLSSQIIAKAMEQKVLIQDIKTVVKLSKQTIILGKQL